MVARIVSGLLGVEDIPTVIDLQTRLRIALEAGRFGAAERVARALSWQEFEKFCDEILTLSGFETRRGVVFKHESRRWQIDLIAKRDSVLLSVDCKHWKSPGYSSKIEVAAEHQEKSLGPLIKHLRSEGSLGQGEIWALPVILTLMDPRESIAGRVAVVSLVQLSDLVGHLTPYDPELPFIYDGPAKESPISQRA